MHASRLVLSASLVLTACYSGHGAEDPSDAGPRVDGAGPRDDDAGPWTGSIAPDCDRRFEVRRAPAEVPEGDFGELHATRTGWAWLVDADWAYDEKLLATADPALTRVDGTTLAAWPIHVEGFAEHCEDLGVVDGDELRLDCQIGDASEHTIFAFGLDGSLRGDPAPLGVRGRSPWYSAFDYPQNMPWSSTALDEQGYHLVLIDDATGLTPVRVEPSGAVVMGASSAMTTIEGAIASLQWQRGRWVILLRLRMDPYPDRYAIWELFEDGDLHQTGTVEAPPGTFRFAVELGLDMVLSGGLTSDALTLLRIDPATGAPLGPPTLVADRASVSEYAPELYIVPEDECGAGVVMIGRETPQLVRVAPDGSIRQTIELPAGSEQGVRWIGDRYIHAFGGALDVIE